MSANPKRPRTDDPTVSSAPSAPALAGPSNTPYVSLDKNNEITSITDLLPPFDYRAAFPPQQVPLNSPVVAPIINEIAQFFQDRYKLASVPHGASVSELAACWHYRLREELWLGLSCGEHWVVEDDQDLGSNFYNTMCFMQALQQDFIPDFHAVGESCNNAKQIKKSLEPSMMSFAQRGVFYQIAVFWLEFIKTKFAEYDTANTATTKKKPVTEIIEQIFSAQVPHIPIANAITDFAQSLHHIIIEYENKHRTPTSILLLAFQHLPAYYKQTIQFTYTPAPPNDLAYAQFITSTHFSTAYYHKHDPIIFPVIKASKQFDSVDLTPHPDSTNPHLAKNYEQFPLCNHERLRREILLTLAIEDGIAQFLLQDSPKILLSLLWQSITSQHSFCPPKAKCAKADCVAIYNNDYFAKHNSQYLNALIKAIPQQEKITLYRYAQHVLYGITNNTVPQSEMWQWLGTGIESRKKSQFPYDNVLSIAAKTFGPFPQIINDAINDSPYGIQQEEREQALKKAIEKQMAKFHAENGGVTTNAEVVPAKPSSAPPQSSLPPLLPPSSLPQVSKRAPDAKSDNVIARKEKEIVPPASRRRPLPNVGTTTVNQNNTVTTVTSGQSAMQHMQNFSDMPFIDVTTTTGLASYLDGLSAVAGTYRAVNPTNITMTLESDGKKNSAVNKVVNFKHIVDELTSQYEHIQIIHVLLTKLLANGETTTSDVDLLKDVCLKFNRDYIALKNENIQLKQDIADIKAFIGMGKRDGINMGNNDNEEKKGSYSLSF